jgi:hypothetical protein
MHQDKKRWISELLCRYSDEEVFIVETLHIFRFLKQFTQKVTIKSFPMETSITFYLRRNISVKFKHCHRRLIVSIRQKRIFKYDKYVVELEDIPDVVEIYDIRIALERYNMYFKTYLMPIIKCEMRINELFGWSKRNRIHDY